MESLERETNLGMIYGSADEQSPKGQTGIDSLLMEAKENSGLKLLSYILMCPPAAIVIQILCRFQ